MHDQKLSTTHNSPQNPPIVASRIPKSILI